MSRMTFRWGTLAAIAWAGLFLLWAAPVSARPESHDLKTFFEQKIPELHKTHHLVGSVVLVFDRTRPLYAGGFGHADVRLKRSADPHSTMFRAGSISKLFTWTAVMQLVEQGRIDLNRDINAYLDFRIPDAPGGPITMAHLMAHTPGFEDRLFGLFYKDPSRIGPLRAALFPIPRRVRPAGVEIAYSNYGAMLAGYVVERVSGLPFDEYVERHIFGPLALRRATFRQPLPRAFSAHAATGYTYEDDSHVAQQFELVNGAPAGAISISAADVMRFYQAHMNGGRGIFSATTAARMHARLHSAAPAANGLAHGFMEMSYGGRRLIGHGGDTIYFHGLSAFFPEEGVGFVFANNTSTGMAANLELTEAFLARFFPTPNGRSLAQKTASGELQRFSGEYQATRRSESDFTKLVSLFMRVQVRADGDALVIRNPVAPKAQRYVPVGPGQFQREDGQDRIVFLEGEQGRPVALVWNTLPVITFRRPPWNEAFVLNVVLIGGSFLIFLVGLIARPTGLAGWLSRAWRSRLSPEEKRAALAGLMIPVFGVAYVVALVVSAPEDFIFAGTPPKWPLAVPYGSLAAALAGAYFSVQSWKHGWFSLSSRMFYSGLVAAGVGVFPMLRQWHLIL